MMLLWIIALSCGDPDMDKKVGESVAWGAKRGFDSPSMESVIAQPAQPPLELVSVAEDIKYTQIQITAMNEQADQQIAKLDRIIEELKKQ